VGWRIVKNRLPEIARALPKGVDKAVNNSADHLALLLSAVVWKRTGMISRVTTSRSRGPMRAEVAVGWYLGKGFYSGFQEFGSSRQAARPIVLPTAQGFVGEYISAMTTAVERACR
jgi:HK97 gp10 family phage protein